MSPSSGAITWNMSTSPVPTSMRVVELIGGGSEPMMPGYWLGNPW